MFNVYPGIPSSPLQSNELTFEQDPQSQESDHPHDESGQSQLVHSEETDTYDDLSYTGPECSNFFISGKKVQKGELNNF